MTSKPIPRKSGAQPGNTNAFRHGFYSRRFRQVELEDLMQARVGLLEDEVTLLRVSMRRVFEYADEHNTDGVTWGRTLHTLATAASRLAYMLRIQRELSDEKFDMLDILSQALEGINVQPTPD